LVEEEWARKGIRVGRSVRDAGVMVMGAMANMISC
jgi:hypothetical protein